MQFVSESIQAFTTRLQTKEGKDIWMMGGAELIASFLDEGAIDEFILHVIPTFIGEGIPLIASARRTVPLTVHSCRKFSDGSLELRYAVEQ